MAANQSILERNICAGLTPAAEALFLRGLDRNAEAAERCANEWMVLETWAPVIRAAERQHDGVDHGVLAFIRERHFRRYFPGS